MHFFKVYLICLVLCSWLYRSLDLVIKSICNHDQRKDQTIDKKVHFWTGGPLIVWRILLLHPQKIFWFWFLKFFFQFDPNSRIFLCLVRTWFMHCQCFLIYFYICDKTLCYGYVVVENKCNKTLCYGYVVVENKCNQFTI